MTLSEPQPRSLRALCVQAFVLASLLIGAAPRAAAAGPLNLGVISYDLLVPGESDAPGITALNIFNFTGDPLTGGFALEPDFPSFTGVMFLDSSLTLDIDGATQVFGLGDIGPGLFASPALLFSQTSVIASLIFTATLSTTSFLLADGTPFSTDSSALTLTLLPSMGSALTPGVDFGVLTVAAVDSPAPIPEPGTITLVVSGLIGIVVRCRTRGRIGRIRFRCAPTIDR